MVRVITRLIVVTILIVLALYANAQTRRDWGISGSGDLVALYKPFIGTRAELDANTNTFYLSATTKDFGGGTWIKVSTTSFGYVENGKTRIIDAAGQVWELNEPANVVRVELFLPASSLSDTADKTAYLQEAFNFSVGKKLILNPLFKYAITGVWCSDNVKCDLNFAEVFAHQNISQANAMLFRYAATRIGYDGKYTGGPSVHATKANIKKLKGIEFYNGRLDGRGYAVGAIMIDIGAAKYTQFEGGVIDNCIATNFGARSYSISNDSYITDSVGTVGKVRLINSRSYYNGKNIGLYVTKNVSIGDTIIDVKTVDGTSIALRGGVGQFVQFGSAGNNNDIVNTGYGGTNKIYRIKNFVINSGDSTSAKLYVSGGGYDASLGFQDSAMGATASIVANTVMLPTENWAFPQLFAFPSFTGVAGQTKANRSSNTADQNARMKNVWVGQSICFTNNPGNYIVTGVYANDSITFTPALLSSFTAQTLKLNGIPGDAVYVNGYLSNVEVDKCFFYAAMHGIAMAGSGGKGVFQEDSKTALKVTNTEFWYNWMSVEMTSGTDGGFSVNKTGLDSRSVAKGDTSFLIGSPASYRTGSKDINNDGVADIFVTNAATIDANVTQLNSFFVGEIFGTPSLHYRYQLTSVTVVGSDIRLGFQMWNQYLRKTVSGGFEATIGNTREFRRIYTLSWGEAGGINSMDWSWNKFYYLWRTGAAGYDLSIRGFNVNVEFNEFYNCGNSALEISGYGLKFKNNKLYNETFTGTKIMPSTWTAKNGTSGKGPGGWGTFFSHKLDIENNEAHFIAPPALVTADYDFFTGRFNLAPQQHTLYSAERFNFSNNKVYGVRHTLYTSNETENFAGAQASPYYYYDVVKVNDNTFGLSKDYFNVGFFNNFFSPNSEYKNNIFIGDPSFTGSFKIFSGGAIINPNQFDTTVSRFNITIDGNQYPGGTPFLGTFFNREKINWNDMYDFIRLPNGRLRVERTVIVNDTSTVSGGTGTDSTNLFLKID